MQEALLYRYLLWKSQKLRRRIKKSYDKDLRKATGEEREEILSGYYFEMDEVEDDIADLTTQSTPSIISLNSSHSTDFFFLVTGSSMY